jgi:hypothetical protein
MTWGVNLLPYILFLLYHLFFQLSTNRKFMKKISAFLLLRGLGAGLLWGQTNYKVLLRTGAVVPPANAASFLASSGPSADEIVQGRFYRILQFQDFPDEAARQVLAAADVQLLHYLPHHAYLASLPAQGSALRSLQQLNLRSVFSLNAQDKMAESLWSEPYPDWAVNGSQIEVSFSYHADLDGMPIGAWLANKGYTVLYHSVAYQHFDVLMPLTELSSLAEQPFLSYLEPVSPPPVPEDFEALSLSRANALHGTVPGTPRYDGTGIKVLVRDDGLIGPHIDFQGRAVNQTNANGGVHHADQVAGAMAGAGNYNPAVVGMAPGADVTIISYQPQFTDNTLSLHQNDGILITNSSYSDGCNRGYSGVASRVDQQVYENTTLMHVFSAGNSGTDNCGYGAGSGWGNITGGHKVGKNVLTVGALNPNSFISGFSSRGPAEDGRIKPDIMAMGSSYQTTTPDNTYNVTQGTSFSAPAAAGNMAQLYQAYKELNNQEVPASGLIKAVMLNTTNDQGNPGPDFRYGWGIVNVRKAVEVLENRQYIVDTLGSGTPNSHTLTVPAGTRAMRIMLYWPDEQAFAGVSKALINDLDLGMVDGSGTTYQPLVLDPTPSVANLNRAAAPGTDTLNNVEQIIIENPTAGEYTALINPTALPSGDVGYYLTYTFYTDDITVTYPMGGEAFEPQEDLYIHWDAHGTQGGFDLSYSLDNGQTWTPIVVSLPGDTRQYIWQTPASISGEAMVRVSRGTITDESDATFSIIETPNNIQFARVCQDFVTMTWDAVPGATSYDVFQLGDKYMEFIGNTPSTFFEPQGLRYQDRHWFAVRARDSLGGITGRRTIAVSYQPGQLQNCALVAPVAGFGVDSVVCVNTRVVLQDQSEKAPENYGWNINPQGGFVYSNGTVNTDREPVVVFLQPGTYSVQMTVANSAGANAVTKTIQAVAPPTPGFATTTTGPVVVFDNQTTGGFSYRWDFGDGDSSFQENPVHTYASPGEYDVTLTVSSPCGDFTSTQKVQAWNTNIEEVFDGLQLQLVPNPSDGKVQLSLSGELAESYELSLLDLQGQQLKRFTLRSRAGQLTEDFDFSYLPAGLYFLQLKDGVRSASLKLSIR